VKFDVRLLREFSGMNQTEFWEKVGITQSGGSRYEAGERRLPKPVQHLLRLIYIDKLDLDAVRRQDMDLIAYLKSESGEDYKRLLKASTAHWKGRRL